MAELCTKAGFLTADDLVQRELLLLCDSVEAKTGVLISLSTVKRLLNGQFSRIPQVATLNAIAVSAGYQSWQDFKFNKSGQLNAVAAPGKDAARSKNSTQAKRKYVMGAVVLILLAIVLMALLNWRKTGPGDIGKAHFSALKVTGNDIPNTVVFKYNVDSVAADSFFIQQSWDKNRRVRVYKNNYTLTDIYYEPGYHVAKLMANDKVIKKIAVSIPTDKWVFYAKERLPKSIPKYINPAIPLRNGCPAITPQDVLNSFVDVKTDNLYSEAYFPSKFENSSDNFVMRFRIRVKALKNVPCPYLMSEVFCQYYFMYFTNTSKGCASYLLAQFGEKNLNGRSADLSALGVDLSNWQDMEFRVKDKKISISINGAQVFSSVYHQSCGKITGLGFTSNGLCELQSVELKTLEGKVIYSSSSQQ